MAEPRENADGRLIVRINAAINNAFLLIALQWSERLQRTPTQNANHQTLAGLE